MNEIHTNSLKVQTHTNTLFTSHIKHLGMISIAQFRDLTTSIQH